MKTIILTSATVLCFAFTRAPLEIQTDKWPTPDAAAKKANPVASDDKSIAAGKTIYINNCKSCHGTKGKGDGPKSSELDKEPTDMTKADFIKQSDGALFYKITEGKKPMPSFKKDLTEELRWQVINYVRTLGKK
jgi:mono/diheme cytochrome c family protein